MWEKWVRSERNSEGTSSSYNLHTQEEDEADTSFSYEVWKVYPPNSCSFENYWLFA